MSLGTLAINNNSDQVAGTATSFATELKVNDFIAVPSGGVTYTMVVKAIASDTALTITRPFSGPNVTGANWAAIPAGTMVGVTAKIADDTSYTMRMYVNEATNWMNLLTVDGDVTVYAPDGSSYTGPSWLKLSRIMGSLDMPTFTTIAAQVHTDALQVAADTQTTATNTATATQAAQTATTAAQSASQDAQTATTKAGEASASAVTAKNEADRAASANPDNQLKKANNLSDLADRAAAWLNVRPDGPTPLAADPVDDKDAATKGWVKTFIASVKSVLASWSVIKNDATAPANNATAYGGELVSDYQVAGVSVAKAALMVKNTVGRRVDPVIRMTDASGSTPTTSEYNLASAGNNSGSGGNSLNIVTFVGPRTQIVTRRFLVTAPANSATNFNYDWVIEGASQFSNYPGLSVVGEADYSGSWRVGIEAVRPNIVVGFIHNNSSSQVKVWVNVIAIGSINI